jgi:hypothetical protein
MTCRCAISIRPSPEADEQRFRWFQRDKQRLSRVEPSALGWIGLPLEAVLSKDLTYCFSGMPSACGGRLKRGNEVNLSDQKALVFWTYYQVIHRLS